MGHSEPQATEHGLAPAERSSDGDVEKGEMSLKRALQSRHIQMMAIGGSIGAGLFVGSGGALRTGGPASLLIGFTVTGGMLLATVQALGELAVMYPVNGAFYMYSVRFIDPAWGFAMGWQYAVGWLLTLPYELVAAGVTINFWKDINIGVWIAVFLVMMAAIQVFGVRGYGETEFVLSVIKVVACIGLIILGIIINTGGVPTDNRGYIGGRYWQDPGAFRNGFKGFCSVFVTAAFAYSGTELVGLTAAEAVNPSKSIPSATKQVFWRVAIFYVVNILLIGLNVPSDSNVLLGSSGGNTKASPFVLAVQLAGIKALPSIINAVITISVISVANSCTYGSTRTLQAMAATGRAPSFFSYIDSRGRPVWCILLQVIFGLLAFLAEASDGSTVLDWLLALTGLSTLFTMGSICLSHILFRRAWSLQGRDLKDLPWRSQIGVAGSWIGLFIVCIALIATFYVALFPVGESPSAKGFFKQYLACPIVIALVAYWKVYTREWSFGVNLRTVNLDEGRRYPSTATTEKPSSENDDLASAPWWRKVCGVLF